MDEPDEDQLDREVRSACRAFLQSPPPPTMRERLLALAARPEAEGSQDVYGQGGPIQVLEKLVADLLGKPASRFVIKGVMAQQGAVRAWCERSGHRSVVIHNDSHLGIDEGGGLESLHHLRVVRFGGPAHFTTGDLDRVREPIGVIVVELPLRRQGFRLPTWDELTALSAWCRQRGIPIHLDGARLWECAPAYDRSEAEIAALLDSAYVSFSKGLGGLAGAALAGDEDLLDESATWAGLMGANVYSVYPHVLSALDGLDRYRPRMAGYRERAVGLAAALVAIDGLVVEPPQASFFCIHLRGAAADLRARQRAQAKESGIWLFSRTTPSRLPGHVTVEVVVTEGLDGATDEEVRAAFSALVKSVHSD